MTASPATSICPPDSLDAITSPVLRPMRISSCRSGSRARFQRASRSSIRRAARTARTASSSRAVGTPKTAMIASPVNFSIVAVSARSSCVIAAKKSVIRARTSSGCIVSARSVEPTTSANRTVTSFSISAADAVGGAGAGAASTGAASRSGSCWSMRRSSSFRRLEGSMPRSSRSRRRKDWYAASASA